MLRAAIILLLLSSSAVAQDKSIAWMECQKTQSTAVVLRHVNTNPGGNLTLLATAYHAIRLAPYDITVRYHTGESGPARIAVFDEKHDLALLWAWCPSGIPEMPIANSAALLADLSEDYHPQDRLSANFRGFHSGKLHSTQGKPSFVDDGFVVSDAILIPGQSGGAMLVDGKLCGIITGGWLKDSNDPDVVWPARCADARLLEPLIKKAMENVPSGTRP